MNDRRYSRRFPRRRFRENVGILFKGEYTTILAAEIGEGGMLVKPDNKPEIGDFVAVNFFIPSKEFITVMGQIVYQRGADLFGMKFTDLDFNSKRSIRDYIALKTAAEAALEENLD